MTVDPGMDAPAQHHKSVAYNACCMFEEKGTNFTCNTPSGTGNACNSNIHHQPAESAIDHLQCSGYNWRSLAEPF